MPASSQPPTASRAFRLPRSAYLAVIFLLFGTMPFAFGWFALLLVLPVTAAVYVARTATIVDSSGIRVRAVLGSRSLPWAQIRGLSVTGRSVYAVIAGGGVRLPCVRVADLAEVARRSAGHVPQLRDPVKRYAPSRQRR